MRRLFRRTRRNESGSWRVVSERHDAFSALSQDPDWPFGIPCPGCGYPTLPERGGYDICWICNWEDNGISRNRPWEPSSPNLGTTLSDHASHVERMRAVARALAASDAAAGLDEAVEHEVGPSWPATRLFDELLTCGDDEQVDRWHDMERRFPSAIRRPDPPQP